MASTAVKLTTILWEPWIFITPSVGVTRSSLSNSSSWLRSSFHATAHNDVFLRTNSLVSDLPSNNRSKSNNTDDSSSDTPSASDHGPSISTTGSTPVQVNANAYGSGFCATEA